MQDIKRILIGLDLTAIDKELISYASYFTGIFDADRIYFIHVAKTLELPEDIIEKYPNLLAPVDEAISADIQDKLDELFNPGVNCETKVMVREGSPADTLLKWSDIKEIDLIIMGRKKNLKGTGVLPGKMAMLAHCSVLFVPEKAPVEINKILVPVDFSKYSSYAIHTAQDISDKLNGVEVILQNSYNVPTGYSSTGKSYEEFAGIMHENAKKDCEKFLKKYEILDNFRTVFILDDDQEHAEEAFKAAQAASADIIVMGSQGRTEMAALLLGSTAQKMTHFNSEIPLLVVKHRKDNLNFFEALFKL